MRAKSIFLIIVGCAMGSWLVWSGLHDSENSARKLARGGMLLVSAGVLAAVSFRRRAVAKEVVQHVEALCESRYEYAPVNAKDFPHLDLAWYDASRHWLEERGFAVLGDEENLTFRRTSKGNRTLLRTMLGRDGTWLAYLYHFKPSAAVGAPGGNGFRILELQTHFANGVFVCTSNAEAAGKLDSPPGVDALRLPANTSLEAVLAAHAERITAFLAGNPGVGAVQMSTLADVHAAQNVLQEINSSYRQKTGITKVELQRLGGNRFGADQIEDLHEEVAELHAERHRKAA